MVKSIRLLYNRVLKTSGGARGANYCDKESINRSEIVKEIAQKCFKDVIPRFQYQNGTFYRHYHEVQNRGYKMPLDEKRYICLFKESIELFRDNYEVLCDEVLGELEKFLDRY